MVETTLITEQRVRVSVAPKTDTGALAELERPTEFLVTAGGCTIEEIDEVSAFIVRGDTPGDSIVRVSVTANFGAGVEEIMDTVLVHVEHPRRRNLGLVVDTSLVK